MYSTSQFGLATFQCSLATCDWLVVTILDLWLHEFFCDFAQARIGKIIAFKYIRCILLLNKLPQNLVALKTTIYLLTNLWVSNLGCAQRRWLVYVPMLLSEFIYVTWPWLPWLGRLGVSPCVPLSSRGLIHMVKKDSPATWKGKSQSAPPFQTIACITWPISHGLKQVAWPNPESMREGTMQEYGFREMWFFGSHFCDNLPYHTL